MIIFQEYVNGRTPHICKFSGTFTDTLRTHSEEVRREQSRAEATAVEPEIRAFNRWEVPG